jgi:3-oxoacyl-[acyl-carrier protein] reductase
MRVALAARGIATLEGIANEIDEGPGQALALRMDLGDADSVGAAVREVLERWGRIDVLVVNGPGPPSGPVEAITEEQWRDALEMNVVAAVRLVRQVLPQMLAQGGGRILFITTIGVRTAQPNMVLSNATRLAVLGLAKTLSLEVADRGVLVNVLAPGPIATERMDELIEQTIERTGASRDRAERVWLDEVPLGRMGRPEDLASLAVLLASESCSFTTGAVIPVDGGKARGY